MARRRRGNVRSGDQRTAERIQKNARFLAEHPELAVPTCKGSCPLFCPFKRARKGVKRRHGMKGKDKKLKRWARWGNNQARAYAAILRIAAAEDGALEYFQNVRTHQGTVPIAPWGKAPALAHVGMQHHHDPAMRLIGVVPFLRDDDAVYVTDEGLVCAHSGGPPAETLERIRQDENLVSVDDDHLRCPHLTDGGGDADGDERSLEIAWPASGTRLRLCDECADGNLLASLQTYMVAPEPFEHMDIRVHLERLRTPEGEPGPDPPFELPGTVLDAYTKGEMGDADLFEEARRARTYTLKEMDRPFVVLSGTVYEPPFEDLVDRLDPPQAQRPLLEAALERLDRPVVLDRETPVGLLHEVWADLGAKALRVVLGEEGEQLYDPHAGPDAIEQVLSRVERRRARQRVRERLPEYDHVPAPVDLADEVARALVEKGRSEAQRVLSSAPDSEHTAMAVALLEALELPRPAWTVEPRERDMAQHLVPHARELLEAEGDEYHDALQTLLKATGSTAELERADQG